LAKSLYTSYEYIFITEVMNMPRRDRMGPMGYGPITGRGLGPCGGGFAFGRGRGYGRGYGFDYMPYEPRYSRPAPITKEEEAKILEAELNAIEEEKKEIESRLKELK
jgi:hypothetical protein